MTLTEAIAIAISPAIWNPADPQSRDAHAPRARSLRRAERVLVAIDVLKKENQE